MKKIFSTLSFLWLFQPLWSQEKSIDYNQYVTTDSNREWIYFKQGGKIKTEDFFKEFSNYLELSGKDKFVQFRENSSIGLNHTWYQQYHNNVKVVGAEYMLHSRSGYVETANGNAVANISINTNPKLTPLEAIDALKRIATLSLAKDDSSFVKSWITNLRKNESELELNPELILMYDSYTKQPRANDYKLCFKFTVIYKELISSEFIYIDANTGELFKRQPMVQSCTLGSGQTKWNGVKNFNTTLSGNSYVLDEQCSNIHGDVHTKKYSSFGVGTEYTDSDNNWNNPTAVTSHWYGRQCLDYFYNTYNRKSFDNQGSDLIILNEANGASPYGNLDVAALVDPTTNILYLGRGSDPSNAYDDYNTLDIIGHEFTHAVTKYTCDLTYQNESGALNESFSDIFGTAIERFVYGTSSYDWTIGEDLSSGALRSLEEPQNYGKHYDSNTCAPCINGNCSVSPGQPRTYFTDPFWYTGTCDNGGVHINSGVQNYWFYLLVNGGSGTNANGYQYNVTGIGFAKAISIVFTELTAGYLGSTSDYNIAFTATKLIAGTTYGYTSTEYNAVVAAWCAVGIGNNCSSTTSCATPSSTTQSNITQTSATLSWGSVASATNYTVQYRVSGTSTWTTATTSNTSYALSNLTCNTTYEWQVRANCASGNSSYAAIKTFTTSSCGTTCTPPSNDNCSSSVPTVTSNGACVNGTVACANGSYGANQCSGCTCTSPDDKDVYFKFIADATSHTVALSNYASNFDGVIELRTACASGTAIGCYDPSGTPATASNTWNNLTVGQTYYIRVFEYNYTGTPPSSPTFTLCLTHSTGGGSTCNTPTGLSTTNVTQSSATLNWGSISSAVSYTLQVRQAGGSWQTFNITSTSYSFTGGFSCNTTYEWMVSANCANGSSSFTAVQSFTTSSCGGGGTCSAPTGLTVSNVGQNTASLSWNSVSGVTYYIVRYRVSGNSWTASNTTSTSFNASGLSCNATYEWQIEAVCPNGNYPTTGTSFTTTTCTNGCINSFQDRTLSAPTCSSPLPPYTSEWQTDYVRVNNVVGGTTYISNHSLGGWITIRYGTYNGTLVAQGTPPLTWTANQGSGTYFIHYNTNSSCGQGSTPGTSTLEIVCCSAPSQPGNITGNTPICSGTFQSYSISAVSGATSYTWTYSGNGTPGGSGTSTNFTPTSNGTLSVVANSGCGSSQPRTLAITVNQAPTQPGTITGATTVCSGIAQTYSISAVSGATSYTWSFSGGGTISGTGTSISFTPMGSGTLSVIANNSCGSSTQRTLAVTVNQTPAVTVNPSTVTICSGGGGTQLNAVSDAQSFSWSPATGLSSTTSQTVTANPANTTTYTVTAINGNCSATATSIVTVSNQLTASVSPANPVICGNSSVSLTATTGTAYSWSGPNGFTDNTQTVLVLNAGNYSVTVTNPDGCSGSATASITVTQNPLLTVDAGANQVIQSGNSVMLGGTPTASGGTPPYTYNWNPTTNLNSSTLANPTASPTSNTTYNLTVTDANGCFATDNVSVITSLDCQTFLFDSLNINVPKDSASYILNLTTGVGCSWTVLEGCSWLSFNNTTGNGTTALAFTVVENTFTSPRTCYVNIEGNILIITQGQAAPCIAPVSDFTASQQAIFAGNSITFSDNSTNTPSQWLWTFNGGNPSTSTAQNPTVTYSSGGLFNVTLKATNACGNNTVTKANYINVIGTVGISNIDFENSISVFPNPNNGVFRIVTQTSTNKAVQLKLFSSIGQLVYNEQLLPVSNKIEKDVSVGNVAAGIYLLQITVNNKPSYKKLIIE